MLAKATPENVIAFIKLSVVISFAWPLSATATRWQVVLFKTLSCLSYINLCCLLVPLVMGVQDCSSNIDICIKSIPILVGNVQSIVQIAICQFHHKTLQPLTAEMESHCKHAKGHERKILQQYVDKCATFYIAAILLFYSIPVYVVCSPFIMSVGSESFPVNAKYPFNVTYQPLRTIIFAQHGFTGLQISSVLCISVFVALLLWFASAKFEMLSTEIRTTSNIYDLLRCIQKHQKVLQYANDVTRITRFLILTIVEASTLALISSGLVLISRLPITVKVQFLEMTFSCFSQVFLCCWPANNLLVTSSDVGNATYESLWYSQNINVQKILIPIILRCQKPVIIAIGCVLPVLSLNYFGSFISMGFSYFMTLRVIIEEDNV